MTQTTETPTKAAHSAVHPDWCDQKGCFDYSDGAGTHTGATFSQGSVRCETEQFVCWADGQVDTYAPTATVYFNEHPVDDLTAKDCRDLATVALAAADKLDEINAGVTA